MKKEEINYVFEQNPELSKIGTKTQYYKYLQGIFPESKVKDIVYHASNSKIEKFRDNMFGTYFSFSKPLEGMFGDVINLAIVSAKNTLTLPDADSSVEEKTAYDKERREFYNTINTSSSEIPQYKYDSSIESSTTTREGIQLKIRKPEQIHILGSKKDIQGFKDFVNNPKSSSLENKLLTGVFITFVIAGLFFSTPSLTGNVIGSKFVYSNVFGLILFIVGIVGFYFLRK